MTITYSDGTAQEAVLLFHANETLRAAIPAQDDVCTFIRVNGTWTSEGGEPVKIEFAWQRRINDDTPMEARLYWLERIGITPSIAVGRWCRRR